MRKLRENPEEVKNESEVKAEAEVKNEAEVKEVEAEVTNEAEVKEVEDQNVVNESLTVKNEEEDAATENDTSESDLLLARLEDIISRFEKALAIVDEQPEEGGEEEAPADEEVPAEEGGEEAPEEGGEEEAAEEEEPAAEESYQPSLEDRLAALERRFTESRRRRACKKFTR